MTETQPINRWIPPTGVLGKICLQAAVRAEGLNSEFSKWRALAEAAPKARPFAENLRREHVGVIAEIKRHSPSKGAIKPEINAADQALLYERGGAAAVSVLTEPLHFGGDVEDLTNVNGAVGIPTLKKDFHVQQVQLFEAKALGASAALIIVRALEPVFLRDMLQTAADINLETLVEVQDEVELELALTLGAKVIGINNRNLETLEIDQTKSLRLLPLIPRAIIGIAESGMQTAADVQDAASMGADAVLIGSSVSATSSDFETIAMVREFASVERIHTARQF